MGQLAMVNERHVNKVGVKRKKYEKGRDKRGSPSKGVKTESISPILSLHPYLFPASSLASNVLEALFG